MTNGFFDGLLFAHPRSVGESYGEHRATAWWFAGRLFVGACAAFIHGLLPGLCVTTGSSIIRELSQRLDHEKRGTQLPAS